MDDVRPELMETLNLIADHLAVINQRLAAIEEDQRMTWALERQIWLNPAPGYVRRGPMSTPVRQEPVSTTLPVKATGVSIPTLE